ncbi:hypothetical protein [Microbacterium pumilum]|uniref:VWFA domain-containing protein n=1 Tax=Microbacterium pumilum TaxID=344165 RepID=A0ABP5DMV4_9MICO
MGTNERSHISDSHGGRRGGGLGVEQSRRLTIRHRWYAGGIATLISAALVFSGVSSPALADTTPTPTPTETTEPTPPAEETTPPAEETTPTDDTTPTPTPAPTETTPPAEPEPTPEPTETTPPAEDVDGATPTPTPTATDTAKDKKAKALADVGVLTVPAPGPTTAVITVKVGSDRTGITGVTNLAGVVLLLNTGGAGGPSGTRPDGVAGTGPGWAICTSDAQGDCSFTVPNTQAAGGGNPAGANRDARYWVVQSSVPAGYYGNPSLRTGGSGGPGTATPYRFRTGTQLRANTVYSSQDANDFMLTSGAVPEASGGIWQQSRVNPTIPARCGLDVALILDLSGSVEPSLPALKTAASTFVDALQGTPSRMSLFSFSTVSPADGANANFPNLTSVSTVAQANAFKARYAGWTATGTTNWDRGLGTAAAANNGANNFDLAVVITDGNPTSYNQPAQGNGTINRFRETENGIFSANALKQGPLAAPAPTRVIAFGVGDGATGAATGLNLRAISGTTAYNGTNGNVADYFQTADYPAAGAALRALALGNCQGTLSVTKQIVPSTAPPGSITGAVAAGGGWQFTSVIGTAGVTTPNAVLTTPADGTGTVNYPLDFPGGTPNASITVTEAQQPGFTLQPVGGQNAVCTNLTTDTPVTLTGNVTDGFTVNVPGTQAVSCTVYNRAPNPPADITVHKTWVINGVTYENGAQPSDFSAQLQLTGPDGAPATNQGWDVTRTGYVVGNTTTISESVTLIDPTMCTNTAAVTNVNGGAVNVPLAGGFPATLSQPNNTVTITNTVICRSTLTLIKEVQGGTAAAGSWTLNASFLAIPPIGTGLPGPSGASGTPAVTQQDVTPNARYQLFETGGDPRYVQTDNRTNLQSNPLSTGSATCIRVDANGAPWPGSGFSDGINGGVNVPTGYRVACTFVNETASLTLLKNVVNDNGGSTPASAWDLTGTPAPLTGLTATTVDGSETLVPASTFQVRPDHVYTLTESDVPGYEFVKLQQFVGGVWVDVVANPNPALYPRQDGSGNWQVTVAGLDAPVYRFVNDDVAPILTLVKTVTNDNGGTATPSQWTLTATTPGGPDLSGATGTAAVTAQPVQAGVVYTIGESGPAAYEWASLTCTGYPNTTRAAPTVTLQAGDNVTCTLNNDDILVPVAVEKADGVVQQLADGTWSIAYEVVVTNTSATLPTSYSLTDTPDFDSSFTILTQGWQGDPDVTDVAIEAGGTDTYTYVVTAEANETPVDPTALVCTPTGGGGFFNTATVTYPGGTDSDTGCAAPASPVVQKTAMPAVQNTTTGAWTLSYEVAVSNPSDIPLSYTLSDTAATLPAGVTGGTWAASDPVAVGGGTFVRNGAWAGTDELATGTLPAGATHTYTITRVVTIAATVTPDDLVCGSSPADGTGIWNTATVTNGIAEDDSSDCIVIERPTVAIEKTVTDTQQLVDGTWEITYDVVVTHTGGPDAAVYSLTDVLVFGGDITVDDASWTGPTGGGPFAADGTATFATNQVIAPDDVDTYTVTAHATVDEAAWTGDTLACEPGERPAAGGFLNVANVTVNGAVIPADDCSEPALPTVVKAGVSATQDPDDASRWLVSYDVTVTSGGYDTFYSLSDTPGFPVGVDLTQGQAQRTDIAGEPVLTITTGTDFVTDVALLAGETHVYRVSWLVDIQDTADPDDGDCTGQPGSGFFNTATLTVGAIPIDDSDCIPVADRVYPTVTKTATSTNQDPVTGDWTITYDIVVNLAPAGPANPDGLSAEYDLTDTLDFGGGIDIGSAKWSGESSGTFPAPDATVTLATDHEIEAGDTHTYTVTVVAEVTAEAVDSGTSACDSEPDGGGGFLNTALLTSGGQDTPVEACSEPIFPEIEKSAAGAAVQDPATGDWTLSYDITVTYPDTDADPLPILGYVLTDAPELPDNVELLGDWTAAAADGDTPTPDDPTWDGTGTWTIVTAAFDPEDDGVTQHVYTVTADVTVTGPGPVTPETCDELQEEGIVVWNTATVTSGGSVTDDDACQVVHFDDVGIEKTSDGVPIVNGVASVEPGNTFDYVLTVTNHGDGPATNVHVTDDSLSVAPYAGRIEFTALDVDVAFQDDSDLAANKIDVTIASLAVGQVVTITVTATFLAAEPEVPPQVPPGDDPPPPVPPLDALINTACVEADFDSVASNNCDDEEIPTRDITAVVYTSCLSDAPLLGWSVVKSALLAGEEATLLWEPDPPSPTSDPSSVTIDETDDGPVSATWSGLAAWPGAYFTPSGVAIDYPGWRAIELTDIVPGSNPVNYYIPGTSDEMTATDRLNLVYNGLILDPSELDYAWRFDSTVTLSVNPSLTFEVSYPSATPDCAQARHSTVEIEKTASVEKTDPGKSFSYTLAVENVSDDSAAEGVVVTDPIPADLKITDVSWVGDDDPATFPNWTTCEVTGKNASGYGGTLTCELLGPLQPAGSVLGPTSAPTITLVATVNPSSKASVITNVGYVDYYTFGDPSDFGTDKDDATVTLSSLPPTGGGPVLPLVIFGILALLAGVTALVVRRRRRNQAPPTL